MTTGTGWAPANEVEARLHRALAAGDEESFLRELAGATLLLPVDEAGTAGARGRSWPVILADGGVCVPAFTSLSAMAIAVGDRVRDYRSTGLRDLGASWPDVRCPLLVDPLTPLHSRIAAADLFRLAARPVADVLDRPGDASTPAMGTTVQRFLSVHDALRVLSGEESLVSGLVVAVDEIEHLRGPTALITGLRLPELHAEVVHGSVAVCALRWPAVGAGLYRPPGYEPGNTTSAWNAAGFVVGAEPPVQWYRIHGIRLPHGAALVQITEENPDELVAWYDADERRWQLDPEFAAGLTRDPA